jgi:hypothetical protein
MPKKKTDPAAPKAPRKPRTLAPEIVEAKSRCVEILNMADAQCKTVMEQARGAVKLRKLMETMTPEMRQTLKASL